MVLTSRSSLVHNSTDLVTLVDADTTILFVSPNGHSYHPDPAIREEGGTPAIVESIRAGLVFQLKDAVGVDAIAARESDFIRRAIAAWSANPNIDVLGNR